MAMTIHSTSFQHGKPLAVQFTQDGENVSPALAWGGVPENAKSLALIVDDPDAPDPASPKMTYVHWVLYNIPVTATGLVEGVTEDGLPTGAQQGKNDSGELGYTGPAPPKGRHRYFFKLHALDTTLQLDAPTKKELEAAMKGHIVGEAQIVGTYQRGAKSEAA